MYKSERERQIHKKRLERERWERQREKKETETEREGDEKCICHAYYTEIFIFSKSNITIFEHLLILLSDVQ